MAMRNKTRIASAAPAAANTVEIDARRTRERLRMMERKNPLRDRAHDGDNTPWADSLEALQDDMAKNEDLAGREVLVARLKALSRAEEKVREGTYGLCDSCGKPIPAGRLQAVPGAVHCVRCAEGLERDALASPRSLWGEEFQLVAA
jgi:RNA polymerase-binding transcription factor DksA